MNWLESARLGMFIHWGHLSMREWDLSLPWIGETSNLPSCQDIAVAEYHQNANNFNPISMK